MENIMLQAEEERASQRVFGLLGRHFAQLAPAAHAELTVGSGLESTPRTNILLAALPADEYEALSPRLQQVSLRAGEILDTEGALTPYAFFPLAGICSLATVLPDGWAVDTALVGREGVVGVHVALGMTIALYRAVSRTRGLAIRIEADALRDHLRWGGELARLLDRFALDLLTQMSASVACGTRHSIRGRCARWLLMMHDGQGEGPIETTHALLAQTLGVRRATITVTTCDLKRAGILRYSRGRIVISDPARLEALTCSCYRRRRAERRELGPARADDVTAAD
jgi:CRP-like cAMP-binding protein